jgi:hypothetical protein
MSCSHSSCRCGDATVEREGKNYCSERCADSALSSAGTSQGKCPCGHPDCAAV